MEKRVQASHFWYSLKYKTTTSTRWFGPHCPKERAECSTDYVGGGEQHPSFAFDPRHTLSPSVPSDTNALLTAAVVLVVLTVKDADERLLEACDQLAEATSVMKTASERRSGAGAGAGRWLLASMLCATIILSAAAGEGKVKVRFARVAPRT